MGTLFSLAEGVHRRRVVSFDRRELGTLLDLYSRRVSSGEWRDYAIDFRPGMAIFSIFRHSAEQPLYAIAKIVPAATRAGRYQVFRGPQRVAAGDDLKELLQLFDKRLRLT
jgi:hypothetical protein